VLRTESTIPEGRLGEWREGWTLVLASLAGMSLGALMTYTTGLFVAPLEAELGWSRSTIMSGLTVNAVMGGVLAPFMGAMIDRFGPRKIAIPGVLVFCAAFALLSTATLSPIHWWGLWFFIGLGALMLKPTIWTYAIVSRFDQARGLALALALSGAAVTGMLGPVLAHHFIESFGWRWAYVALGATYAAIVLPLLLLFFYSGFELSRGGARAKDAAAAPAAKALPGLDIKNALSAPVFWKIAIATMLVMFPIIGSIVHLVPALTDAGLARSGAVAAASVLGGTAIGGRLVAGLLLDRMNARLLAGIAFMLPAPACLLLLGFDGDLVMAIVIAVMFGVCTGAELEMSSYLASKHFGLRNFGTLFGIVAGLMAIASGLAPALAGLAYDLRGSYQTALIGGAVLAVIAGVLIFSLPRHPAEFPVPS